MAINVSFLESLVGYNARRASLHIIESLDSVFEEFGLRPVSFSVLSLIQHNPGITSAQLCEALNLRAPNLTVLLASFELKSWLVKSPNLQDRRATGLSLSPKGKRTAILISEQLRATEHLTCSHLTEKQIQQLISLLQALYVDNQAKPPAPAYKQTRRKAALPEPSPT